MERCQSRNRAETMKVLRHIAKHRFVKLCSDDAQINCTIFDPPSGSTAAPPSASITENLFVSCLMMTRGNVDLLRYSLACYVRQTYPYREMVVVVEPEAGEKAPSFPCLTRNYESHCLRRAAGLDHR